MYKLKKNNDLLSEKLKTVFTESRDSASKSNPCNKIK